MQSIPTDAGAGGSGGGIPEAASNGLSKAAGVAGDVVRGVVPDFVLQRIPFIDPAVFADVGGHATEIAGLVPF